MRGMNVGSIRSQSADVRTTGGGGRSGEGVRNTKARHQQSDAGPSDCSRRSCPERGYPTPATPPSRGSYCQKMGAMSGARSKVCTLPLPKWGQLLVRATNAKLVEFPRRLALTSAVMVAPSISKGIDVLTAWPPDRRGRRSIRMPAKVLPFQVTMTMNSGGAAPPGAKGNPDGSSGAVLMFQDHSCTVIPP